MYILYCDESNLEERTGDFLIYGGLFVPAEAFRALSTDIDALRLKMNVSQEYKIKFNPGPKNLDHQEFIKLKKSLIEVAEIHGVKLICYVILHDVAKSSDEARRNGINTLAYHFDCILNRLGSAGLMLVDQFTDEGNKVAAHLREKFSTGVTGLPYAGRTRLANIVGFHYSAIGQSHMTSLVDVVVGCLRFAINAHTRDEREKLASAKAMLNLLSPLFWRGSNQQDIRDLGFTFSPMTVKVKKYRERYDGLKSFLIDAGVPVSQQIHAERPY